MPEKLAGIFTALQVVGGAIITTADAKLKGLYSERF